MRISDWSSDVCSSDLEVIFAHAVLDRLDRVIGNERGEIFSHLLGAQGQAFAADLIFAVLEKFGRGAIERSEEHTSELQSLMRNSYAVFCLKTKNIKKH